MSCFPRQPEESALYRVVSGHLETFLALQQQSGRSVPHFVERELREYLNCGVLASGFLRLRCEACGHNRLLPLSCKGRAVCPSCCGRRMADTAAHLVDRVFPEAPVRQWVLSLPHALRYRLAYDSALMTDVLQVYIRALFGFYRRRARDCGIEQAQCGAVTFVQRFGSSANLHLHFHVLCIDGVYAPRMDGTLEFFSLRPPENSEVAALAGVLAERIPALLRRRGMDPRQSDAEESDPLSRDQPWLAEVYAASVCGRVATGPNAGRRVVVSGDVVDTESMADFHSARCASVSGFSLHGDVAIPARDRARLERLCKYAGRPPLSLERLEMLPDGRLRYGLKTPWRNGTTHVIFEPVEFLEKLCALVPTPRAHMVRYHGLLGPAAAWRPLIVPNGLPPATVAVDGAAAPVPKAAPDGIACTNPADTLKTENAPQCHPRNYTWAELMRRVFAADVLSCQKCGGKLRILAVIRAPEAARKILDHLRLPSRPPPLTPANIPELPFFPA